MEAAAAMEIATTRFPQPLGKRRRFPQLPQARRRRV